MNELQTINVGKVTFQLKEEHCFKWLGELGEVFSVFPDQDSGNISFGIEIGNVKRFVKYAGAKTKHFSNQPFKAIETLKRSVTIYRELQHKFLVNLLDDFAVGEGYALVFDWFDGENLHSQGAFPPPLKYTHPDSPYFRFKQLPIIERLKAFQCILEFHAHMENKQYVAIDFYDGSILYDFNSKELKICDIDLYKKKPYINSMGRMWGSSRFMSPEEFKFGATIDERTNVFNMGAIAFGLLGGELDRSISKWDADQQLYEVAMKAVNKNRNERFASVEEFLFTWKGVLTDFI